MVQKENPKLPSEPSEPPVQFWTCRTNAKGSAGPSSKYWFNVATRSPQVEMPKLGRGGILSDGMGLGRISALYRSTDTLKGKTLSILSLILASKAEHSVDGYSNTTLVGKWQSSGDRCNASYSPISLPVICSE